MSNSKPMWFKFYPQAWLSDSTVCAMSPEERGGYFQLLCHQAVSGPLPENDNALARLSGLHERWESCGGVIKSRFVTDIDGNLINKKLSHEIKAYYDMCAKNRAKGKASAEQRLNRSSTRVQQRLNQVEVEVEKEVDKEKTKKHICIYDHWNSLTHTTKHRTLTDRMKRAINGRFKEQYTAEEICTAITNYDFVIGSDKHYFSYKWPLDLFLSRSNGFPSFVDSADPRENYLKRELKEEQASKAASNKGTIEDVKLRLGM